MLTHRPRGTSDILPDEAARWRRVEAVVHRLCQMYGYGEIRTPVFEHTELFLRGVGDDTDIVEKEMYTFTDRGGRSLSLRPEGTAGVVRAFLESRRYAEPLPAKFYYATTAMFRYDRPQAGRYRQFHQFGVEAFGSDDPMLDAETVALAVHILGEVGLPAWRLRLNSIGCPVCRPAMREGLRAHFGRRREELCADCRRRLETNPLRLVDCKREACRAVAASAPRTVDYLCEACGEHFTGVQRILDLWGVRWELDPTVVRGLDYYTRTVFEISVETLGAQDSVAGGGRYDGLVAACGGPDIPGVGFAVGMERLLLALPPGQPPPGPGAFLIPLGDAARIVALRLVQELRRAGVVADVGPGGRSLKSLLRLADRARARYAVLIGEDELANGAATVRDMSTGEQHAVAFESLAGHLQAVAGG